ncbi:DUF899 family protein [Primorskyibacter sp. S87]|uniref:DUF899 family protein n=1 Tax=Primorskyibacter sp. S87 TaxID=3415126 RepID=UPI003C7BCFE1
MHASFPNESESYRSARNKLLAEEIALRGQVERVAALRRSLPEGGEVTGDYVFAALDGRRISFVDLFGNSDTLLIYSLMYSENAEAPCPMCCGFLDGLSPQTRNLPKGLSIAVVANSNTENLRDLKTSRNWTGVDLYSAASTTYQRDYLAETEDGAQLPIMNVFVRKNDRVHHFWGSELFFADSPWHPRHLDQMWPLWNILDVTPQGRGDHLPSTK